LSHDFTPKIDVLKGLSWATVNARASYNLLNCYNTQLS
jgi:hypothetical protein